MTEVWNAANEGDWCAFMETMGGPFKGRYYSIKAERGLKLGKNGECTPPTNQYGEPLKTDRWDMRPVIGLRCGQVLRTYAKFWVIARGTVEAIRAALAGDQGAWTSDNSCRKGFGGIGIGQGPPAINSFGLHAG